jgi:hypothetical protein
MSYPSAFHSLERQPRRGPENETVLTGHSFGSKEEILEGEKEFACWVEMMGVSVGCGGKGLNEDSRALPPSRLSMTPQAFNTQRIFGRSEWA